MKAINRIPYTYLLEWKDGKKYYGVRFAKGCKPEDLWNPYKTSSNHIKNYCKYHGDPVKKEIRKTFSSIDGARNWETKVLRRLHVVNSDMWLNKTDNKAIDPDDARKGASKSKSEHMRMALSITRKGMFCELNKPENIQKATLGRKNSKLCGPGIKRPWISEQLKGNKNRLGFKDPRETKQRKQQSARKRMVRDPNQLYTCRKAKRERDSLWKVTFSDGRTEIKHLSDFDVPNWAIMKRKSKKYKILTVERLPYPK